jgi:hypothetical protein
LSGNLRVFEPGLYLLLPLEPEDREDEDLVLVPDEEDRLTELLEGL